MRNTLLAIAGAALLGSTPAAAAKFSPDWTSLQLGTGIASFARAPIRDNATPAVAYDLRLTVGTRFPIAFEAAYVGSFAREHDAFAPDPGVTSNALTGSARVNLTTWRVQPFIVGGAGWVNLHSYGRDQAPEAAANFAHDSNGGIFPVGGGLAGYLGRHGMIEARASYDFLVGVKDFTNQNIRPDMWEATIGGGYAF